ncbi:MAG: restriction endonuclease subunit S [Prevotella sp.]|jgi:restriction endonuclease S subunit|nr:restriction endonuclease subunit S [Prevotella sp.]
MQVDSYKYLHFVPFSDLSNWSVQYLLENIFAYSDKYNLVETGSFLIRNKTDIEIEDEIEYKRVTIKINNGGIFLRNIERGINIGTKKQYIISEGQFLLSRIDARNGAFGIVPKELDRAVVTNDFPAFDINSMLVNPDFLPLITTTKQFIRFAQSCSSGTTNRQRMDINKFLVQKIPLPSLAEQQRMIDNYNAAIHQAKTKEQQAKALEEEIENYLCEALGIENKEKEVQTGKLHFVKFSFIQEWGIERVLGNNKYLSSKYNVQSFAKDSKLSTAVFRGKSPKYSRQSKNVIINQKCNRWNEIDLKHAKTVDTEWLNSVDKSQFTKEGDILINSTGEGTIGRASTVTRAYSNLLCDSHILLLRVNKNLICPDFFTFIFNSFYGQQQVNSLKTAQSTNQTELGIDNLKNVLFPVPLLSVQKEIVNRIQIMQKQIKNLRQSAEENRRKAITEFEKEIFK